MQYHVNHLLGLGVTLVGSVPKAGIRFGGNSYCKKLLEARNNGGKLTMGDQFLAGMGAGTIEAIFAVTPMETIKTKLIQKNMNMVEGNIEFCFNTSLYGRIHIYVDMM